jgi:hypothetical protein
LATPGFFAPLASEESKPAVFRQASNSDFVWRFERPPQEWVGMGHVTVIMT